MDSVDIGVEERKLALQVCHHTFQLNCIPFVFKMYHASCQVLNCLCSPLDIISASYKLVDLLLRFIKCKDLIWALHGNSCGYVLFLQKFDPLERLRYGELGLIGHSLGLCILCYSAFAFAQSLVHPLKLQNLLKTNAFKLLNSIKDCVLEEAFLKDGRRLRLNFCQSIKNHCLNSCYFLLKLPYLGLSWESWIHNFSIIINFLRNRSFAFNFIKDVVGYCCIFLCNLSWLDLHLCKLEIPLLKPGLHLFNFLLLNG